MNDWRIVFSTSNPVTAEIAKSVLGDKNITSVILNKQDSFYKFGELEVHVKQDDYVKARHYLKELK